MATRHQARSAVVSLLYAGEMGSEMNEFKHEFLEEKKIRNEQKNFSLGLFEGVNANLEAIDERLNERLNEHKLAEIGEIERAILRLGAYELLFSDTDKAVIINECVNLAKELASDTAPKFINGVLENLK
ncbi:MAG: transcription antitermination factor NusB [Campylobacter sp.]|nr:transcription antitermination factor NusB [Campylobacter sp.]